MINYIQCIVTTAQTLSIVCIFWFVSWFKEEILVVILYIKQIEIVPDSVIFKLMLTWKMEAVMVCKTFICNQNHFLGCLWKFLGLFFYSVECFNSDSANFYCQFWTGQTVVIWGIAQPSFFLLSRVWNVNMTNSERLVSSSSKPNKKQMSDRSYQKWGLAEDCLTYDLGVGPGLPRQANTLCWCWLGTLAVLYVFLDIEEEVRAFKI